MEAAVAEVATDVIRIASGADRRDVSPLILRRLSDESLGSRLASGEAAAFDELYRRYAHRLAAYGGQLLGDGAAGDDVAQASLIKAYVALRDGRVPERVKPWLYRIAHNCAVDLVVRRRELPIGGLPDQAVPTGTTEAGELIAAFAALPDRQRHVYVLRELHGLRIDETAAELGLAPAQVEQALFAARNRLAELLVFGERLSCVAVRRLACGPLDTDERRALKTHLRSCAACRQSVGATGRALGILPVGVAGWLRALPAVLAGGGSPAAVKLGVVVATATLATGAPIAYEVTKPAKPRHVAVPIVHQTRPMRHAPRASLVAPPRGVAAVAQQTPVTAVSYHAPRVAPRERSHAAGDGERRDAPRGTVPHLATVDRESHDTADDNGSSDSGAPAAAPANPVVTSGNAVPSDDGEGPSATTAAQSGRRSDNGPSTSDGSGGHGAGSVDGAHDGGSATGSGSPSGGGDGGPAVDDGGDSGTGDASPAPPGD
jgi:RNA polymerase sigma factor (sigma-70 family)